MTTATEKHVELTETYGAHNYHPLQVVIAKAEGAWVEDVDGKRYLDCLAAYSAVNQGHCHPRMLRALHAQAANLTLTSRAFMNDQTGPYFAKLAGLTGKDMVLPMNTGAEAVETAIKVARKWGYEVKGVPDGAAEIVVFDGNFHGRTTTIISFSSAPEARTHFGPYTPGFVSVPYGDLAAAREAVGPNTVGILVEPIQGEAGVVVPPDGFLKGLRELCDAERVLLLGDEIQTGLGRTGRMFACDHEDVVPDVYILGKALAGGFYPVSAIAASREVLGVIRPGEHGSTFGGNPLACALACEALDILVEEELCERSAREGAYLLEQLAAIESPHVESVRGRGLFCAIVIKESSGPARPFCYALKDRGVLCKETHDQVIRLAPPLVISREDLDLALGHLREVLAG